jgi:siroheme synthase-like protein
VSLFPLFLKLQGRPCLVIGAGAVAAEKIPSLLKAGARVRVIAPAAHPLVEQLAFTGKLDLDLRLFQPNDLDGIFMVIAATDDPAINHEVYLAAVERNILCNSVDDPPNCDFFFGSVVTRGDLQIAISTAGESPALAQRLRKEIDDQLPHDLGPWLANLGELRREILATQPAGEPRKLLLHTLAQRQACEAENCPSRRIAFESAPVLPAQKASA